MDDDGLHSDSPSGREKIYVAKMLTSWGIGRGINGVQQREPDLVRMGNDNSRDLVFRALR